MRANSKNFCDLYIRKYPIKELESYSSFNFKQILPREDFILKISCKDFKKLKKKMLKSREQKDRPITFSL